MLSGTMPPTVHPRGCGEHVAPVAMPSNFVGSSPRVRGTLGHVLKCAFVPRFIPAGAGNTPSRSRPATPLTVHPRGCGEHNQRRALIKMSDGSSPRVRGTPTNRAVGQGNERFIPAGAGNTAGSPLEPRRAAVHPRGCGEHVDSISMRILTGRFIPAGAGNTMRSSASRAASIGSSPRVRGTRRLSRSTPAARAVHPRGCGEHHNVLDFDLRFIGSSPRVRGTQPSSLRSRARIRFIPAGAGNTLAITYCSIKEKSNAEKLPDFHC